MPRLTLKDLESGKMRCLFYGPVGTGKTTLCASTLLVPEMCPILYMDVEGGVSSVKEEFKAHWSNMELWSMDGEEDVDAMMAAIFSKKTPFKTVILDSLTEFHAVLMAIALSEANKAHTLPQIQDYGDVSVKMLKFFRRLRKEAKVHFLATASESFTVDEMARTLHTEPDLVGQLTRRIPRFFNLLGHLTARITPGTGGAVKKDERRMQVQPFGRIRAKDRSPKGRLGAVVTNPTMQKLWDAVYVEDQRNKEENESG